MRARARVPALVNIKLETIVFWRWWPLIMFTARWSVPQARPKLSTAYAKRVAIDINDHMSRELPTSIRAIFLPTELPPLDHQLFISNFQLLSLVRLILYRVHRADSSSLGISIWILLLEIPPHLPQHFLLSPGCIYATHP